MSAPTAGPYATVPPPLFAQTVCTTCGAVVHSQQQHSNWHREMAKAALDAGYAAAVTRPIGGTQ